MAGLQSYKEQFTGKYDGISPETLLPNGWISDGLNMRKVGPAGGWKPRKGCYLHNATQLAAASILSLHQYTHPRNDDYHFFAQCNSNLYDATNDPDRSNPSQPADFGSSVYARTTYKLLLH
jgi:hypothetical protein